MEVILPYLNIVMILTLPYFVVSSYLLLKNKVKPSVFVGHSIVSNSILGISSLLGLGSLNASSSALSNYYLYAALATVFIAGGIDYKAREQLKEKTN
jgi:hypothetical protein